jgi:hypothetical protein
VFLERVSYELLETCCETASLMMVSFLWVSYIVLFDMDINMLITLPEHVDTKSRPQKNIMYCSLELLLKCIIFKYVHV